MSRGAYVVRRLGQLVPIAVGLVIVVFLLIHLVPGDPVRAILGERAPQSAVDEMRAELGLDQPLLTQFADYVGGLAKGDLGESIRYSTPVLDVIVDRLPPTLGLLLLATLFTILLTLPLATVAAVWADRFPDHIVRVVPLVGLGMPAFWLGLILLVVFAVELGWFPVGGYGRDPLSQLHSLILPAFTIALAIAPITIRSLRAALIDVLDADFILTARSKGLPERRLLARHGVRNAVIPTIAVLGVSIGWLIGNTLVIERVFAIPGIGALMLESVRVRDFPVVQGVTLVVGVIVVVVALATDLAHASLDPRVRLGEK
jgi:peptide/nickel transport system permease protein